MIWKKWWIVTKFHLSSLNEKHIKRFLMQKENVLDFSCCCWNSIFTILCDYSLYNLKLTAAIFKLFHENQNGFREEMSPFVLNKNVHTEWINYESQTIVTVFWLFNEVKRESISKMTPNNEYWRNQIKKQFGCFLILHLQFYLLDCLP